MQLAGRAARFTATDLESVQFITYRGNDTSAITCGARTPAERIYLTWRPAADAEGLDGIAVAVEFLPW